MKVAVGRDEHCLSLARMDISRGTWMLFKAPGATEEWEILAGLCRAPFSCTPGTPPVPARLQHCKPEWAFGLPSGALRQAQSSESSSSICVSWILFCRSVTNQTAAPKAGQWGHFSFWNLSAVCWINTCFVSLFLWLPQPGIIDYKRYNRYNQIIKEAAVCPLGIFPYTAIRNTLSVLAMPFMMTFSQCF